MQRFDALSALRVSCEEQRKRGLRVAFVPTMGALHDGHKALVEHARSLAPAVVVSIFVNPKQFAAGEDLQRYPRDPDRDAIRCQQWGVTHLFTPSVEAMYPCGFATRVDVPSLGEHLCGRDRPGHFAGVCTVVARLLNCVGPCDAVFGEKDFQQLRIVSQMVEDLLLPVKIHSVPTVRERDGLARSSRNAYLSSDERRRALVLYQALGAARARVADCGAQPAAALVRQATALIEGARPTAVDYVAICDLQTLDPVDIARPGRALMCLAVRFGKARLIDNMRL